VSFLNSAQGLVVLVLTLAAFAVCVFAFVDAIRRPAPAFEYAGKRTKQFWSILLGVAVALAFVSVGPGFSFLVLIAVVAAAVYLTDVRPAVRTYGGGGASGRGPYGGW
jgi:4-amino-4-deoxy-L-arabinose transferase-like glycosyltransferase